MTLVETAREDQPLTFTRHQGEELKQFCSKEFGSFGALFVLPMQMIVAFAELTGDKNPLHLDTVAAANGPFGKRVAHGALILTLLPRIRPRPKFEITGSHPMVLSSGQKFCAPVFPGNSIRARERLAAVRSGADQLVLKHIFEIWNTTTNNVAIEGELLLGYG